MRKKVGTVIVACGALLVFATPAFFFTVVHPKNRRVPPDPGAGAGDVPG